MIMMIPGTISATDLYCVQFFRVVQDPPPQINPTRRVFDVNVRQFDSLGWDSSNTLVTRLFQCFFPAQDTLCIGLAQHQLCPL